MTNLENVKDFIRTANRQELQEIRGIYNVAFKNIQSEEKDQFKKGDIVQIVHPNYEKHVAYEVIRKGKKNITISNVGLGKTYRVSPHYLEKAEVGSFPKLK